MSTGGDIAQAVQLRDEDLTDDQILIILQAAEQRLKAAQSTSLALTEADDMNLYKASTSITTGPASDFPKSYIKPTKHGAQVESSHLVSDGDRKLANSVRVVEDPLKAKMKSKKEKKVTAGSAWFDLPRTVLTPELKRDLQLLRMRSVLDPKRHYKRESKKSEVPEYSQVGTIIEGPTEFFTARLSNKERKRTLLEETLAKEKKSQYFKSKYDGIQKDKTSGRSLYYKGVKAKRASKSQKG